MKQGKETRSAVGAGGRSEPDGRGAPYRGRGGSDASERLLTREEVAALLKVTGRTVVRWQQEGVLPYLRMGNAVRFYWPAVVNHLIRNYMVCGGQAGGSATWESGKLGAEMTTTGPRTTDNKHKGL